MKKSLLTSLAASLVGVASMSGQATWQTQKLGEVKVDTIYHATVGPGTTQTQIKLSYTRKGSPATSTVTYSTSDLTNEYVTIKAAVASDLAYGKPQTVKTLMDKNSGFGHRYFVGINGDFAGLEKNQSIPCGALFVDGSYVTPAATLSGNVLSNYIIIGHDGTPTIAESIQYCNNNDNLGTFTYPNGAVNDKLRFNTSRGQDQLIGYSPYYGYGTPNVGFTNTNEWGTEATISRAEGSTTPWGHEAEYTVQKVTTAGNAKIPSKSLVISANGTSNNENIKGLKAGDTVKVKYPFKADGVETSAREVVGGWHVTVKDGKVQDLPSKVPSDIAASTPRARTAVGYNADKTKFIMAVVQEDTSKGLNGMTIVEFGDVLASLGCDKALNLDGGGSSVMFVENLGQRSQVQGLALGGFTRAIANGLFAVAQAPDEDSEVASIEFVDKHLTIKPGRGYQPVIYAYNKYGVLISTGLQNYKLSAPQATFDASGRKMIAPASGYFALTAEYNGIKTSIPVKVDAAGVDGSDPATAPSFKGDEFVEMFKDPNAPIDPADYIYAQLEDVTPAGYDFNKYEVGHTFEVADIPELPQTYWTTPAQVYTDEFFAKNGHVTALHQRTLSNATSTDEIQNDLKNGLSIQDLGGEIGKCLVYTRTWGPGASIKKWPAASNTMGNPGPLMFSFYSDAENRNKGNYAKPIRVRLVFQVLHRSRHDSNLTPELQIPNIYACARTNETFYPLSHDGVSDDKLGAEFPIDAAAFYRWENEGTTIAEMPEKPVLKDLLGKEDPWDTEIDNKYQVNPDRFMVYEFDCYSSHDGQIGVHMILEGSHNTIIFKEIKFFNILNGEELAEQPRSRAAGNASFKTNSTYGSLLATRNIGYRYYTPEGVKEIDTESAGIDEIVNDENSNAPVEYYNLQGMRVMNPANGIFIKRQGSKATKVMIH
ncbi:MAG: phosphodiester glycosidase family protein [Clostridiales bacterium]|nr:phosphodiester glycosidase family protein [Clostridiales bacterium]